MNSKDTRLSVDLKSLNPQRVLFAVKDNSWHFSLHLIVFYRFERNMRRTRSRGMRGGPGRMPPFMRGPPGQKFVVSHSTFDPAMVGTCIIRFCRRFDGRISQDSVQLH